MAAIANITINDALETPVPHVFKHRTHSSTSVSYLDATTGSAITIGRIPSKNKAVRKVRVGFKMPIFETISGSTAEGYVAEPRIVGYNEAVCDFIIHGRSSNQGKLDFCKFVGYLTSIPGNTQINDLVLDDLMPF